MSKKQVTFADIAAYTHFSKTTISRYFNHPDSLTLEIRKKFLRPLIPLDIKKINLQKFWRMEKVNLSESLFRIFICIIFWNADTACCPATVIITTNFSSLAVNMGLKKNSNILKSSYPIRLKVSLFKSYAVIKTIILLSDSHRCHWTWSGIYQQCYHWQLYGCASGYHSADPW